MPIGIDYCFLRSVFRLRFIFQIREKREIYHSFVRPDQLMKQFLLACQNPGDQLLFFSSVLSHLAASFSPASSLWLWLWLAFIVAISLIRVQKGAKVTF